MLNLALFRLISFLVCKVHGSPGFKRIELIISFPGHGHNDYDQAGSVNTSAYTRRLNGKTADTVPDVLRRLAGKKSMNVGGSVEKTVELLMGTLGVSDWLSKHADPKFGGFRTLPRKKSPDGRLESEVQNNARGRRPMVFKVEDGQEVFEDTDVRIPALKYVGH